MKNKYRRNLINMPILAFALATGIAQAGLTEAAAAAPEAPVEDVISGVPKLDFNSHFISYGADVWKDGTSLSEPTFNPMIELAFALPNDLTATVGTWMDINSKVGGGSSPNGGRVQEVDFWTGLSYSFDKLTVSATYQAWTYVGSTEDILDIKFAYDTILAPSLTIHNRLDAGASGGNTGTVLVLGLGHSMEAGPVAVSFPVNIAYFLEDDFHAGTDNGFGFASVGVAGTLPLSPYIGDGFGAWDLNAGLTYYITDDEVIPGNPVDSFLTASAGLSVAF